MHQAPKLISSAACAILASTAYCAPTVLDFSEIDNTRAAAPYILPLASSYAGKGFVIDDLIFHTSGPTASPVLEQGLLFSYFKPGAEPEFPYGAGNWPFKSADPEGKSLFPQYSTANLSLRAVDGSPFRLTSLKLGGFLNRDGEFTRCEDGPASCKVRVEVTFSALPSAVFDLALDDYEGFEKWAFNLDDVVELNLHQTSFNLAQGISGWSYQFDDIILNGDFDPVEYETFAVRSGAGSQVPEPTSLYLVVATALSAMLTGLLAPRRTAG